MGKKKGEAAAPPPPASEPKKEEKKADESEKEEDTPEVKALKALDDEYLAIEKELDKELLALREKYTQKQLPLLTQRHELLQKPAEKGDGGDAKGTPALEGFWKKALCQCFGGAGDGGPIEEWDLPVLEYLQDIRPAVSPEGAEKGFILTFHFAENPYFSNTTLEKEVKMEVQNPWSGNIQCVEIKGTEINWKPGKNVTVESVKKKAKGGGSKKQKAKSTEEPRSSFFSDFFRSLKLGDDLPEDCTDILQEACEDEDEAVEMLLDTAYQMSNVLLENVVPYAVRWYTGEAKFEDDDDEDDDDDEEDEEEDEEESEDEESEDEPPPAKKKGEKKKPSSGGQQKTEECKQQ